MFITNVVFFQLFSATDLLTNLGVNLNFVGVVVG